MVRRAATPRGARGALHRARRQPRHGRSPVASRRSSPQTTAARRRPPRRMAAAWQRLARPLGTSTYDEREAMFTTTVRSGSPRCRARSRSSRRRRGVRPQRRRRGFSASSPRCASRRLRRCSREGPSRRLRGEVRAVRGAVARRESSVAQSFPHDWRTFADAVEDELHGWDNTSSGSRPRRRGAATSAREQAEAAISDLRRRRKVAARLAEVRSASAEGWEVQKTLIETARRRARAEGRRAVGEVQ